MQTYMSIFLHYCDLRFNILTGHGHIEKNV